MILQSSFQTYYQSPNRRACSSIVSQLFPHPDRTLFGSARFLNYHQFLGLQDRFSAQTTTSEERKNKEKKPTEKKIRPLYKAESYRNSELLKIK